MRDNYFDEVIQEKLQTFEVEYDPTDWEWMEARLDAEEALVTTPTSDYNQWKTLISIAAAICIPLLFAGIYYWSMPSVVDTPTNFAETQNPTENTNVIPPSSTPNEEMIAMAQPENNDPVVEKAQPNITSSTAIPSRGTPSSAYNGTTRAELEETTNSEAINQSDIPVAQESTTELESAVVNSLNNALSELTESLPENVRKIDPTNVELNTPTPQTSHLFTEPSIALIETDETPTTCCICPSIRVGVHAAGLAGFTQTSDPFNSGYTVGARVEAEACNLAFVTGLNYTQRGYTHEYFAAEGNDLSNEESLSMRAIEVPTLLRYRFSTCSASKFSFFVQAGVNNMISLREKYSSYDPYGEDGGVTTSEMQTPRYLPSLQFAPGVEWNMCGNFALQVEPFFQYGLKKFGVHNRKLHAAGIGLSLLYGKTKAACKTKE